MRTVTATLVCTAAATLAAGSASADTIQFSYNYSNLSASYNGEGPFTAVAANAGPDLTTSGFVSRNVAPEGTAFFSPVFPGILGASDFRVSLSVFDHFGPIASGAGSFIATDLDGDTLSGDISGLADDGPLSGWRAFGPFVSFSGLISNAVFTPAAPDHTSFDGLASSFDISDVTASTPYTGAFVLLYISTGGLFTTSLDGIPVEVSAQLVPAPGSAALAMTGALLLARRRRNPSV